MVGVIDYRAGNLASVQNALTFLQADFRMIQDDDLSGCDTLILPGVGAFGPAAEALRQGGQAQALRDAVARGVPLLGICLGMQLFFEGSQESPGVPGLGLLPGQVERIVPGVGCKIPQIGWNPLNHTGGELFQGVGEQPAFYFVHSYHANAKPGHIIATVQYGVETVTAMVADGPLLGAQCHPERSGRIGLRWLENFLRRTTC